MLVVGVIIFSDKPSLIAVPFAAKSCAPDVAQVVGVANPPHHIEWMGTGKCATGFFGSRERTQRFDKQWNGCAGDYGATQRIIRFHPFVWPFHRQPHLVRINQDMGFLNLGIGATDVTNVALPSQAITPKCVSDPNYNIAHPEARALVSNQVNPLKAMLLLGQVSLPPRKQELFFGEIGLAAADIGLPPHQSALRLIRAILPISEKPLNSAEYDQKASEDSLRNSSPSLVRLFAWFGFCFGLIVTAPYFWVRAERLRDHQKDIAAERVSRFGLLVMFLGIVLWGFGTWPLMMGWRMPW